MTTGSIFTFIALYLLAAIIVAVIWQIKAINKLRTIMLDEKQEAGEYGEGFRQFEYLAYRTIASTSVWTAVNRFCTVCLVPHFYSDSGGMNSKSVC